MTEIEGLKQVPIGPELGTSQSITPEQLKTVNSLEPADNKFERVPASDGFFMNKDSNKPVDFNEGCKLVAKGFLGKIKDIGTSIIKHPVKAIGLTALTVAGIAALPLIGISSAVGASVLAIGFAGLAIFKGAKHVSRAMEHNKTGQYDNLRDDLINIGGDGLDLALSLPFVPKGIKTVKNYAKYGPQAGFNSELWNGLKEAKNIGSKITEFRKADLRIKYEQMGNEMGLKVKPKLVFDENMPGMAGGQYQPETGMMKINPIYLSPGFRAQLKLGSKLTKVKPSVDSLSPESFLRHELEHFRQTADIVNSPNIGIDGLKRTLVKYNSGMIPDLEKGIQELEPQIKKLNNKVPGNKSEEILAKAELAELNKSLEYFKTQIKLSKDFIQNPDAILNKAFYEDVIKNSDKIEANSEQAAMAQKYLDGFLGKLDDQKRINELIEKAEKTGMSSKDFNDEFLKIYEANPMETPAYAVQRQYIKDVMKHRPDTLTSVAQANSAAT